MQQQQESYKAPTDFNRGYNHGWAVAYDKFLGRAALNQVILGYVFLGLAVTINLVLLNSEPAAASGLAFAVLSFGAAYLTEGVSLGNPGSLVAKALTCVMIFSAVLSHLIWFIAVIS